ncbi:MAG: hypothetical protein AAFQ92_27685, partial [Bacteroidota bacterium]
QCLNDYKLVKENVMARIRAEQETKTVAPLGASASLSLPGSVVVDFNKTGFGAATASIAAPLDEEEDEDDEHDEDEGALEVSV